MAVTVNV